MTIGRTLYTLLIGPLELLFETIYVIAFRMVHHPGWSIVFLSLAMNFLVLPLYKQADAKQAEERDREERMRPWIDHIKRTFNGDERFMLLQTYYRQNDYKPTQALAGSFSLLLEVPFFIAAYNFLSNLQLLNGTAFGPIKDLGTPDGLIRVGSFAINLLPVLMTAINMVSAAIYMKGFPLKSKIQMYGIAIVFLVFLYDSPAGLVFYWTLNNLFSLFKNIFYKLKNPGRVLKALFSAMGIALALLSIRYISYPSDRVYYMLFAAALLQLPAISGVIGKKTPVRLSNMFETTEKNGTIFAAGCGFLAILTGILIPSAVIEASPSEFVNVTEYSSPLQFVLYSFLIAAGTFVIWFGIFYYLSDKKARSLFSLAALILSFAAVADYMFFGQNLGILSSTLEYENEFSFSVRQMLLNALILTAVAVLAAILWHRLKDITAIISCMMCVAVLAMSVLNIRAIKRTEKGIGGTETVEKDTPHITLSRSGRNVFVLMLDRAISSYIPYIMNEKPEVREAFGGFVYYPNTISHGAYTNTGSPGLYGGYEYIPEEINKRPDESLVEKQNEADKVMPVLFDKNGFEVTVCDPTYAGYLYVPDLSIYDDYPSIKRYVTMGAIHTDEKQMTAEQINGIRNHNFFCYSIMKCSPLFFQGLLYNSGSYNSAVSLGDGSNQRTFAEQAFLDSYAVLKALPDITAVSSDPTGAFVMMSNNTTHEIWQSLQEPEYVPSDSVDNRQYDLEHQDRFTLGSQSLKMETEWDLQYYQANMAAMLNLGNWFNWLRAQGLYDNTRIILVSDHGYWMGERPEWQLGEEDHEDLMSYNALLLVKDFESNDPISTSNEFMTNADVPTLATAGLIDRPVNPFTGNLITNERKNAPQNILFSDGDGWNVAVATATHFSRVYGILSRMIFSIFRTGSVSAGRRNDLK